VLGINTAILEHAEFGKKLDGIQDATAPHDTFDTEENSSGDLVGDEFSAFVENGVAGIGSAVVAQDVGVIACLAKMVGNFAFPAIPVLEIDYDIDRLSGHN
jgi:hypothetical protein